MRLPKLNPLQERSQVVAAFGGYDRRAIINDGEWNDEENLCLDEYPTAKVRGKHGVIASLEGSGTITGILEVNGKLAYTRYVSSGTPAADHGTITYTDAGGTVRTVDLGLDDSLKKFVRMGAYVIVQPDMAWVNTADLTSVPEHGDLSKKEYTIEEITAGDITVTALDENLQALSYTASATEPADPAIGDLWYSTGTKDLLQYYEDGWKTYIGQTCIKLAWEAWTRDAFDFEEGLYINIDVSNLHGSNIGTDLTDGYYLLRKTGTDSGHPYIIIEHPFYAGTVTSYDTVVLKWSLPQMDFMIESGNRLWGCYYGKVNKVVDGVARNVTVNEIYASALGSFKEWYQDLGISTDAFTASVGGDGPWTGAVTYQGNPIFFKEKTMHRVYGSYPAQYQIQTTECKGVQPGCGESLAIVDNVLYYKATDGFCAYDGSLPTVISAALGDVRYSKVTGGSYNRQYFASAYDGKWHVLIYDARLGLWHHAERKEYSGDTWRKWQAVGNEMHYIDASDAVTAIHTWYGSGTKDTDPVEWFAETGDLGLTYKSGAYTYTDSAHKRVTRITIRAKMGIGSFMRIEISYDGGEWEQVSTIAGWSLESFFLPMPIARCDHFRLRFSGRGPAQIYSIDKTVQGGSKHDP